jgi:hypothetical protein
MPTPPKWYVISIFWSFLLIFHDLKCFSCVSTHFGASENSEGTPGVGWHAKTPAMFDFIIYFIISLYMKINIIYFA